MDPSDLSLLSRLLPAERVGHGVPTPDTVARHEAAAAAASRLLGPVLMDDGIRVSPLGPGWSRDIDLHVTTWPASRPLLESGWLPLDPLLRRLGSEVEGRWAIVARGQVLAGADLTTAEVPDPLAAVRRRALRRGEVRVREVLELRVLQRRGVVLPAGDAVVQAAATLEAAFDGDELQRFAPGLPGPARREPVPLPAGRSVSLRHQVSALRRATRPRVVVGVSGVDGSGKSSLTRRVANDLDAVGVPASVVWTRPGMRLRVLAASARLARRLLRRGPAPTVRAVADGQSGLASRQGAAAWLWAVAVSVAFAGDVRRRHAGARGVVLYDRHLLDALVTLDFVYDGVDLRLARWVVRRAVPRASLLLYVDIPVDVAVARKPGDTFGEFAVRRQLDRYAARRDEFPDLVVLDGQGGIDELTLQVLGHLTGGPRNPVTARRS